MFHPLIGDLGKLKDQDLENKILDLSKKYSVAANMGQGGICGQILAALDMYREEQSKRQAAALSATMKKQNKGLDDLINVE
jgi:hypothetical protein